MARSHSIYILVQTSTGDIVGAFTVKKEMLAWRALCAFPTYCVQCRDNQPKIPPKVLV